MESSLSVDLDQDDSSLSRKPRGGKRDHSNNSHVTPRDDKDDFNREIRKKSQTIASISDDGNADRYK